MVRIEMADQFPINAEALFEKFCSTDGRREMMVDYVRDVTVEGEGVGAIYRIYTGGHLTEGCVVEKTVKFIREDMNIEVSMVDTGGVVPFANYYAGVRVQAAGPQSCVLTLYSSFVPIGMSDSEGEQVAMRNYESVFARLHEMFPLKISES